MGAINGGNRIHTITIYLVDGMPKPSCDALYVKQGEEVRWETAVPERDFEIEFVNSQGFQLPNGKVRTDTLNGNPGTDGFPAGKLGHHKYSIALVVPPGEEAPVLDPTIDIGKP